MKKVTYMGKDRATLLKELMEKREALRSWRFDSAGTKKRDVNGSSKIRKDIARVMTELNRNK